MPPAYAAEERANLEDRLVEVEARILELLSAAERYALLARNPATEDRVRPFLDRVFSRSANGKPIYAFECHGSVCKVESPQEYAKWMSNLQDPLPGREMFGRMTFGRDGTFIELNEEAIDGRTVIMGIFFGANKDLEACELAAVTGTLSIAFSVDAPAHSIRVSIGGSLAREPVAECVRKALESAIARGYVSPNLPSLPPEPVELTLPLPAEKP